VRRLEDGECFFVVVARQPTRHHAQQIKSSDYAPRLGPLDSLLDCLQIRRDVTSIYNRMDLNSP